MGCWLLQAAFILFFTVHGGSCSSIDTYSSLMDSLLRGYSKNIRPLREQLNSVDMEITLFISSINDVIAVEQKMITSAFLHVEWIDEMMTWNDTEWGNIHRLYLNQVLQF
jgi:hypothetical protein